MFTDSRCGLVQQGEGRTWDAKAGFLNFLLSYFSMPKLPSKLQIGNTPGLPIIGFRNSASNAVGRDGRHDDIGKSSVSPIETHFPFATRIVAAEKDIF